MNFRTIEPVTIASARRKAVSWRRRSKRVFLLGLMAALMFLAFAVGLVWWAFV